MVESRHLPSLIRVLVADDHPAMREGLAMAINREADMELAGQAGDGEEAIALYRRTQPTIAVLDLQMPNVDGLEAIASIRQEFPAANILVLTSYPGDARVMRALSLGATSYLLKSATLEEIVRGIRASVAGRHVVASEAAHDLAKYAGFETLSLRELNVLRLAATGQSNKAIAEALFVSEDTIKSRMRNIMAKLGANDRTHAVMLVVQRGFLDS